MPEETLPVRVFWPLAHSSPFLRPLAWRAAPVSPPVRSATWTLHLVVGRKKKEVTAKPTPNTTPDTSPHYSTRYPPTPPPYSPAG